MATKRCGSSTVRSHEQADRLEQLLPDRPYWSSPNFIREMEAYYKALGKVEQDVQSKYDALLIVGGSGPIVDLANNHRVHELILMFRRMNKPIGAECYGVACLAFARDLQDRKSIVWGKRITGHCKEYNMTSLHQAIAHQRPRRSGWQP
jgi:putative intracellular protease/amidase